MPFLAGSLGFERFSIEGFDASQFTDEHIELLASHPAGNVETSSTENIHVGFLGGSHLFDQIFDLDKNVINEAVHCSVRIDTNQVPSAIRKAWLQMEIEAIAKDSPDGNVTRSQRKEAKEAMEQRCEVEAASGKYRKMQSFPFLWDVPRSLLYFGGSAGTASGHCMDLVARVFGVELHHISAGGVAKQWATDNDRVAEVDDLMPANFVATKPFGSVVWMNEHSQAPDFLGNEFLLWLWWYLETESNTLTLVDQTEVTVMMTKTLSLECPTGEDGKDSLSSDSPVRLPEAKQAARSGKLPRKSGMTVIRDGQQFDLVLQAESFGISGAKIHIDEDDEFDADDRIDAIRTLSETVDQMFHVFLERRTSEQWESDLESIIQWLEEDVPIAQSKAA